MSTYSNAGVNLDLASEFIDGISKIAKTTLNSQVIGGIGGFAGLFKLPSGYTNPVLVACTDGVGTKLKLVYEYNSFEGIGQDLVAMCLNDLLCSGAKPLFFLDYLATEKLNPKEALIIANSIGRACLECKTVLLGGETAELPNMLPKNGYELAGFAVGIVEEHKILDIMNAQENDILLALPSSGAHSNGYSLIRKIIDDNKLDLNQKYNNSQNTLLDDLMRPTFLYGNTIEPLFDKVKSIAHITGGGLPENLPRAFDSTKLQAVINKDSWEIPPLFKFLQEKGLVEKEEMFKVFNMGIGLILIISPAQKKNICDHLENVNQIYFEIGHLALKSSPEAPSCILSL